MSSGQKSLRRKLIRAFLVCSLAILVLSLVSTFILHYTFHRNEEAKFGQAITDVMASRLINPIQIYRGFGDRDALETYFMAAIDSPLVSAGLLFDAESKELILEYSADPDRCTLQEYPELGATYIDGEFQITRSVSKESRDDAGLIEIGRLVVFFDDTPRSNAFNRLIVFFCLLGVTAFLLAWLLAGRFVQTFSRPLESLTNTARQISENKDYALRAEVAREKELKPISGAFNHMLSTIQTRESELQDTSKQLEERLEELKREIETRKEVELRESELQEQLIRAQRMESLGVLAGGVAHDLNNILGPLVGYPEMMLEDMEKDDPDYEPVLEMKESAMRASVVIQDLLTMARRGKYEITQVDLNRIASNYLKTAGARENFTLNPHIRLETRLAETPIWIEGSPPHLSQVIMNLVINACEAMADGGQLTVEVQLETLQTPRTEFEEIPTGTYGMIRVEDTGSGISEENLVRIFEPFFSSKSMGRSGSGLGLSVVWGVIKDLKGFVEVHSEVNKGTEFRIYFPITKAGPALAKPMQTKAIGNAKIMVIDDDPAQSRMASLALKRLGYHVEASENGSAAIKWAKTNQADLFLVDMIMEEGFDGLDTIRELKKTQPNASYVICSGYCSEERIQAVKACGVKFIINKPYTIDGLGEVIQEVLLAQKAALKENPSVIDQPNRTE